MGYLPRELYKDLLEISDKSLNKYARKAGVVTPALGKGLKHRYSLADTTAICRYIIDDVPIKKTVNNAKKLLQEIERKSKSES